MNNMFNINHMNKQLNRLTVIMIINNNNVKTIINMIIIKTRFNNKTRVIIKIGVIVIMWIMLITFKTIINLNNMKTDININKKIMYININLDITMIMMINIKTLNMRLIVINLNN